MTVYYTVLSTQGRHGVIPVKPGQDRWLMAVRYVNEFFPRDDFLAELRPATSEEIAAGRTEYSHLFLDWLARDL